MMKALPGEKPDYMWRAMLKQLTDAVEAYLEYGDNTHRNQLDNLSRAAREEIDQWEKAQPERQTTTAP
jgi:hypothetical protein